MKYLKEQKIHVIACVEYSIGNAKVSTHIQRLCTENFSPLKLFTWVIVLKFTADFDGSNVNICAAQMDVSLGICIIVVIS